MPCGKEQRTWETTEEKMENLLALTIAHCEGNDAVATESKGHYLLHQMDVSATNGHDNHSWSRQSCQSNHCSIATARKGHASNNSGTAGSDGKQREQWQTPGAVAML